MKLDKWVHLSVLICTILVIWSSINISWSKQHYKGIIKADGKGYYAHLPALFIYHDLNFGFFNKIENETYYNPNYFYDYRKQAYNQTINKYFAGTSLAMMPFFAIAHAITAISGLPMDGYSKWYQILIGVAAIFYMIATLYVMAKCLQYLSFKNHIIALSIPIIVFGTNWYYYVVSEPSMSHVYSIFFISLLLLMSLKWGRGESINWVVFGLNLGIIIFIRPVNAMAILLVPLCFDKWSSFSDSVKELFKSKFLKLVLGVMAGLAVVSLQLIVYKIQTGHFLIYSYEEEGFNFLEPQILNFLFSYKKGLFLYTPIFLISLLGFGQIYHRNNWQGFYLAGVLTFILYILSSWWNWYYGGSFSSRAVIEYYVLFIWLVAALISMISKQKKMAKYVAAGCLVLLVGFCQFQTLQYRHMLIHWDNMNKEKYWEVFMKTKREPTSIPLNNQ